MILFMSRRHSFAILSLAIALSACNSSDPADHKTEATAAEEVFTIKKYEAGQVWKIEAQPNDDSASLMILKVERSQKGDTIVHVRLDNIHVYNSETKTTALKTIAHLPFSVKALDSSVIRLQGRENNLPEFETGYQKWKSAYDQDQGGYWKLSVRTVLTQMNLIMRKPK
jgi:hypothetical protein